MKGSSRNLYASRNICIPISYRENQFNRNSSYHIGRKAEINSVNFDMFSFTWVVIAKYVIVARKERLGAKTGIISQAWDLK